MFVVEMEDGTARCRGEEDLVTMLAAPMDGSQRTITDLSNVASMVVDPRRPALWLG